MTNQTIPTLSHTFNREYIHSLTVGGENLKTILFIGCNKSGSSREAIKAAENLGYYTVLFTNNPKQFDQRNQYPEVHKMVVVNTEDLQLMRNEIIKLQKIGLEIVTIVSFVDPNVHVASVLCDEFCHNRCSSKAIDIMEDKEKTRNFLKDTPYSPKFQILNQGEEFNGKMNFPIMIKSPKSTGSKDVLFAQNKKQMAKHITFLQAKYPLEPIILEEFIVGPQYLIEVIVMNNEPHILAVIKQDISKGKRYIITGYRVLAAVPEKIKNGLEELCKSIVQKFEIETGYFHVELRLTSKGWKIVEINPRISGGAMNKMIEAAYGINIVEQTLKLFIGETPNFTPTHHTFVYTKYLIVRQKGVLMRVTGKNRAINSQGIYDVYIKPKKGTTLYPPLSMGHRYAYIISQGKSVNEAVNRANQAANKIKFHMKKI